TFHGSSFPVRVISRRIMRPRTADATEDLLTFLSGSAGEQGRLGVQARAGRSGRATRFPVRSRAPPSPLCFDGPARRRQAEPCPSVVARPSVVHTIEALEDSILMRRRDARATVLNLDGNLSKARLAHRQPDGARPGRVLDRIVEEID